MNDITEYRSIESMQEILGKTVDVEPVWQTTIGKRKYLYFRDKEGNGWYKTQIRTPNGWEDEEQAIFGRKKGRR